MKILMLYPKFPNTFWSFKKVLNYVKKKAPYPPLGLLTIGSMLPREWKKKLVDLNITNLKTSDIMWADMIFISAMIVQKDNAQAIINRCKKLGKIIVAGGPLFTTGYEDINNVDHFVLGEAEITLQPFLDDLKNGNPKHIYKSSEKADITKTPVPLFSLIDYKDYSSLAIQFSRGCPFNCEFCDIIIMLGRVPRLKTPEQMITEIQTIYDLGYREEIFIVDDNFIGNKKAVKLLLDVIIDWQIAHDFPFTFLTEATLDLAQDEELMMLMSSANFNKVFIGIETPSIESLKECGKYQNLALNLEEAIITIHQHGMQVLGGFIVGFDNDRSDIFDSQINFIQKTGVVTAMVGILTALPETKLWKRLKGEGRLIRDADGTNTSGGLNFIPKMGTKVLVNGYKKILTTIYNPKYYYQRIDTFIKSYKSTVKSKIKMDSSIKPFFKSILRIGMFSKNKWLFWKMIFKTLFTNPKAFPIAIEMAIVGTHFAAVSVKVVNA
ncbi:MAG: DUF4070 domain-containing protein [Candidatus Heimdallarchaeota archaeon]|nr:DUF4070 domain-containing protein [Candidatus Heimdallarchaeota archaeon]MCK4955428.1 DUF4070 domain-containing protein [Candidatus Heimdallarchaeota archaeon]